MYRADVAAEFFQLALPSQVLNIIDLNTLQYVNANFLDNTLGEGTVDLVYTVNFKGKTGYLWLLCEHQSSQDHTITLRMQKYMLRICTQHLKENPGTKLPLIYPILAYSGKTQYSSSLSFWDMFDDKELAETFFTKPIQILEISKLSEENLRNNINSGLMLYFLQKIHEQDILPFIKSFANIIEQISLKDFQYIEDLLVYVLEKGESKTPEDVVKVLQDIVSQDNRGKIMNIAEHFKNIGLQQGMERGMQQGMERGIERGVQQGKYDVALNMLDCGQSIDLISKVTGLKPDDILQLQSKVTKH